jgi:hypothetical protein
MSELKFWMKEVEGQLIDDQALRDSSEDLDDNDNDVGDLQGTKTFEGSNFGTSILPGPKRRWMLQLSTQQLSQRSLSNR